MAFRNPVRSLPSSAITGQIPGSQITGTVPASTTAGTVTGPVNGGQVTGTVPASTTAGTVTGPVDGGQLVPGTVTGPAIAPGGVQLPHLENAIMAALAQKWWDFGTSATKWAKLNGTTPVLTSESVADASGGTAMRAVGYGVLWRPDVLIPYDPRVLYRVSVTVRQTVSASVPANQRVYLGLAGVAADRVTLVNTAGANSASSQAVAAARGFTLTTGTGWQTFTGYVQGYGATVGDGGPNNSLLAPMAVHPNIRYVSPFLILNYTGGSGTQEVDGVSVEVVQTGPVDGAVHIIPGTVVADRFAADAFDGKTMTAVTMNSAVLNAATVNGVNVTGTSTVTGATVQTSAAGARIVMDSNHLAVRDAGNNLIAEIDPDDGTGRSSFTTYDTRLGTEYYGALTAGDLRFGLAGVSTALTEAFIAYSSLGGGLFELLLSSGANSGVAEAEISLLSATAVGSGNAQINLSADKVVASGVVTQGNVKTGRTTITPSTANTPTSLTVTGLGLVGTSPRGIATASTTVVGSTVTGVATTSVTTSSFILWVTRTDTVATNIDWMIIAGEN